MMHEITRLMGKRMCNECDVHDSFEYYLTSAASGSEKGRSEGKGMRPKSRSPRGRLSVIGRSDTDERDDEGEASEDRSNGVAAEEWICWQDPR